MFRTLTTEEEATFRQWARDNYTPLEPIKGIWHPVVQDECRRMNETADERCEECGKVCGLPPGGEAEIRDGVLRCLACARALQVATDS